MKKKLYKVTESITTLFVSERPVEQAHELRVEGSRYCERERALPARLSDPAQIAELVEVVEVKSLDDLPVDWTGDELFWGDNDEELTVKQFLREASERKEEEIERLKNEIESLASRLRELGVNTEIIPPTGFRRYARN